jgi:hypothetical protein
VPDNWSPWVHGGSKIERLGPTLPSQDGGRLGRRAAVVRLRRGRKVERLRLEWLGRSANRRGDDLGAVQLIDGGVVGNIRTE